MSAKLFLVAIPVTGREATATGRPLTPGIHLRWSFPKELTYPRSGFRVERRIRVGEFRTGVWQTLDTVRLPTHAVLRQPNPKSAARALMVQRTVDRYMGAPTGAEDPRWAELVELIYPSWPRPHSKISDPPSRSTSPAIDAKKLDLLLLASVDPEVAVALGLGFIDSTLPPGIEAEYRVTGLWGAELWRWAYVDTRNQPTSKIKRAGLTVGGVKLESDRRFSVDETSKSLVLTGLQSLPLVLGLGVDARQAYLDFEHLPDGGAWIIRAYDLDEQPIPDVSVRPWTRRILIESPDPFQTLEIGRSGDSVEDWKIRSFRHRPSPTRIDDQVAEGAVGPVYKSTAIRLTELTVVPHTNKAPILPEKVGPNRAVRLLAAPDHENGLEPSAVVVSRLTAGDAVRIRGPAHAVGPQPDRITALALDGTDRGTRRVGNTRLHELLDGGPRTRPVMEFFGGHLETRVGAVRQLGESLIVSAWVRPAARGFVATLVDNDYQNGFWLGLLGTPSRVRFWVNGRHFESSKTIALHTWSHVAASYDGQRVTIFIDGKKDAKHVAVLGPVRSASDRVVIGASRSPRGGTRMNFRGFMMDVGIHHLVVEEVEVHRDEQVDVPFNGSLGSAVQEAGSARFVRGHPEEARRQVLELDDPTWVSIPALSEGDWFDTHFHFSAWVRPEPGQTWPTIFGNDWQKSV